MADVLNRFTKEYRRSVHTPDYPAVDWIRNPDLSAVAGLASKYWLVSGDTVSAMSQAQRDAVDAQEAADEVAADRAAQKTRMDTERLLKAMAVYFAQQINVLRQGQSLPPLSAADVRAGIKALVDTV